MSYISRDDRLVLPKLHKKGITPGISYKYDTVPSSSVSDSDSNQSKSSQTKAEQDLRRRLLLLDQFCFLTGSARSTLDCCHIISTVRGDPDRREQVEQFLTRLAIHPKTMPRPPFVLNSIYNCILLDKHHHADWDHYGNFLITPSFKDLQAILLELRADNARWQIAVASIYHAPRILAAYGPPYRDPEWEILIIHPECFLPPGETVQIFDAPAVYSSTDPATPNTPRPSRNYEAAGDGLYTVSDPSPSNPPRRLAPFRRPTHRPPQESISSLAVILNAHIKLGQLLKMNIQFTTTVANYHELLDQIVEEIYFIPTLTEEQIKQRDVDRAVAALNLKNSRIAARTRSQGYASSEGSESSDAESPSGSSDADTVTEEASTYTSAYDEMSEMAEESNFAEDSGLLDWDGLTKAEFDEVLSQYENSTNAKERARLGGMLLFGVDGHIRDRTIEEA